MHHAFSLFLTTGAKLLNVPQVFDNFNPKIRQIVESFSTFDYLAQTGTKLSNLLHLSDKFSTASPRLLFVNVLKLRMFPMQRLKINFS